MAQIKLTLELPEDFQDIAENTDMQAATDFAGYALTAVNKVGKQDLDLSPHEIIAVASLANFVLCLTNERLLELLQEVDAKCNDNGGARVMAMAAVIAGQNAERLLEDTDVN